MSAAAQIAPHTPAWHAARAETVGASEVAALYDAHPHLSRWTLWHIKAGRAPPPAAQHERAAWGLRLERAIADAVAEERGWVIEPGTWLRDPSGLRLSATPDFLAHAPDRPGRGVLEIKNVDWLIHRDRWGDEPPMHVLLQLQAQLAVTGARWGCVAALVGGNDLRLYDYDARPAVIQDIRKRVAAFWRSIAQNQPPPVDGSDSTAATLEALHPTLDAEPIDLRGDNEMPGLCAALREATEARKRAEEREAALKAMITERLAGHARALVQGWDVRVAITPAKPPTVITPEMVGEALPGRKESRRLMVKEKTT